MSGTSALTLRFLGGCTVLVQGEPLRKLRSRQGSRLLILLALNHQRPLERSYLAGLLWPESPEATGLALLRRTLTDLRAALGPEAQRLLAPTRHTLRLDLSGDTWLDSAQFERLAQSGEPAALAEAIALYQGAFLDGMNDDWVLGERERLQRLMVAALERRAALVSDPEEVVTLLRRSLALDPLREEAVRALLRALAARGDTAALSAVYAQHQRRLRRELDTFPDEATTALYRQLLRASQVRKTATAPEPVLPVPLTRFVGRCSEREALRVALTAPERRLLTLTGLGGVGKTRLAIEVARSVFPLFPGGVWFVPLAEVTAPAAVPSLLQRVLNLPPAAPEQVVDQVIALLASRGAALLVWDNCEHLDDDTGALAGTIRSLLERLPNLTCLLTSRKPLGLSGEEEHPLRPLPLPRVGDSVTLATASESLILFLDRAPRALPLTPENVAALIAICQQVDGMPLALEMAAAWLRTLSPSQIQERLSRRLEWLVDRRRDIPERHRSLRAVLEWSYGLLSPERQECFAAFSLFRGGWDSEAAEALVGPTAQEALTALEEHSLLLAEPSWESGGRTRYQFLEVVREFAAEKLAAQGRAVLMAERHADYCLALATAVSDGLVGPDQERWHLRMDQDYANVRAALDTFATYPDHGERFLMLLAQLSRYWERRSYFHEAYERCLQGGALHGDRPLTAWCARALLRLGVHCWHLDRPAEGVAHCRRGLAYFEETGDLIFQADAHQTLGNLAALIQDYPAAREHFARGLHFARVCGDPKRLAMLLGSMGSYHLDLGDAEQARPYYTEQLAVRRTLGDWGRIARSLSHLGRIEQVSGNRALARHYYTESLTIHRRLKNRYALASDLTALAKLAREESKLAEAYRLAVESLELDVELGLTREQIVDLALLIEIALAAGQRERALWFAGVLHGLGAEPPTALGEGAALLAEPYYAAGKAATQDEWLAFAREEGSGE